MTLLIGAWTIGLILSLLAIGVFISFRIFSFPDITTEGSLTTGAAITATLLVSGVDPVTATFAGFCGGTLAGALTGILHTKFQINGLLAGILVMTALYSINLHIMGKSNVPLLSATTLTTYAEWMGKGVLGGETSFMLAGWEITTRDAAVLLLSLIVISVVGSLLYFFFRTNLGTAMRATETMTK